MNIFIKMVNCISNIVLSYFKPSSDSRLRLVSQQVVMPTVVQALGHLCPTMWGIFAQGFGHGYPRLWASVPVYVGMDTRVHGYERPCTWV